MIENYAEKIKHESNGFIRHNGIRIVSVDEERSVLEAEITDNSRNVWGSVHGGFLYTMADTAAGGRRTPYSASPSTQDARTVIKILRLLTSVRTGRHLLVPIRSC